VFVEGYDDEGGGEDEHHVAEGDAQERALCLRYVVGRDYVVLVYELSCLGGAERDHGGIFASGADAGFDSEPGDGVEKSYEEYDRGREPEIGVESSQERE